LSLSVFSFESVSHRNRGSSYRTQSDTTRETHPAACTSVNLEQDTFQLTDRSPAAFTSSFAQPHRRLHFRSFVRATTLRVAQPPCAGSHTTPRRAVPVKPPVRACLSGVLSFKLFVLVPNSAKKVRYQLQALLTLSSPQHTATRLYNSLRPANTNERRGTECRHKAALSLGIRGHLHGEMMPEVFPLPAPLLSSVP
jgi:hypothetical protein